MSWSTGEVGGASGVTMVERTRERGCRRSRGGFLIPLENYDLLLVARSPQQFAIASAHQSRLVPLDLDQQFFKAVQASTII